MKKASVLLLFCIVLGIVVYRIDAGPNFIFPQRVFSIPFVVIEGYNNDVNYFSDRLYGTRPMLFTKKWMGSSSFQWGDICFFDVNTHKSKKADEAQIPLNIIFSYVTADKSTCYTYTSLTPGALDSEMNKHPALAADDILSIKIKKGNQIIEYDFLIDKLLLSNMYIESVDISNTGKYILLSSSNSETVLIDWQNGRIHHLNIRKYIEDISPNDNFVLSLVRTESNHPSEKWKNYIENIQSGEIVELEETIVNSVFSEENDYIIGYDKDYNACIFNLADGKLVKQLSGVTVSRTGTKFSMEKDVVLTVCSDITSRKLINPFVNEGTFIEKTEISTGNQTLYEIPQGF